MPRQSSAKSTPTARARRVGETARNTPCVSGREDRRSVPDRGDSCERARPLSALDYLSWAVQAVPNLLGQGWSEAAVRGYVLRHLVHPRGGDGLVGETAEVAEIGVEAAARAFRLTRILEACRLADDGRRGEGPGRPSQGGRPAARGAEVDLRTKRRHAVAVAVQDLRGVLRRSLAGDFEGLVGRRGRELPEALLEAAGARDLYEVLALAGRHADETLARLAADHPNLMAELPPYNPAGSQAP